MKITNKQQLNAFENTVDKCASTVWVMSPFGGRQYDLKNELERYQGLAEMMDEDMEIYTTDPHDSMLMEHFLLATCA